jgi:hypothetical protein
VTVPSNSLYGRLNKFSLETVDEVSKTALGDKGTQMVYDYFERKSCSPNEIPMNSEVFCTELRNILSVDNSTTRFTAGGTPLGRSVIVERTISRILCCRLGLDTKEAGPVHFPSLTSELRVLYNSREECSSITYHGNQEAVIN